VYAQIAQEKKTKKINQLTLGSCSCSPSSCCARRISLPSSPSASLFIERQVEGTAATYIHLRKPLRHKHAQRQPPNITLSNLNYHTFALHKLRYRGNLKAQFYAPPYEGFPDTTVFGNVTCYCPIISLACPVTPLSSLGSITTISANFEAKDFPTPPPHRHACS